MPEATGKRKKTPSTEIPEKKKPDISNEQKELPEVTDHPKEVPEVTRTRKKNPEKGNPENMVQFGDRLIEIKPTLLRYQRDRTAVFYRILEMYPLVDVLGMDSDSFGDDRDGDKAVFDWLIAVTNDPELVEENYDKLDTDTIEKMLSIFRRVNKIDEKEEKLKNALAPGAKKKG